MTLGAEGLKVASCNAVLNANYMMHRLGDVLIYPWHDLVCMNLLLVLMLKRKNMSALDLLKHYLIRYASANNVFSPYCL